MTRAWRASVQSLPHTQAAALMLGDRGLEGLFIALGVRQSRWDHLRKLRLRQGEWQGLRSQRTKTTGQPELATSSSVVLNCLKETRARTCVIILVWPQKKQVKRISNFIISSHPLKKWRN